MKNLTEIERLLLATLEESGEEHLSALINTVIQGRGKFVEIDSMKTALEELLYLNLINIAQQRNSASLEWIPLDYKSSSSLLHRLETYLTWSENENLWIHQKDKPRIEILLTEEGGRIAYEVLSEYGCPDPKHKISLS